MASQPIVVVQAPPVVVQKDGQDFLVPSWPMALAGTQRRSLELIEGEDGTMALAPIKKRPSFFLMLISILAVVPVLLGSGFWAWQMINSAVISDRVSGVIFVIAMVVPLGFVVLSWLSSGNWVVFDRSTGLVSFKKRPFGILRQPRVRSTIPIADVVCVQLIYNGFHQQTHQVGAGEGATERTEQFYAYQMNLSLVGEGERRTNLEHHSDWQWMREVGPKLAEYLQVPLVDQLRHGA